MRNLQGNEVEETLIKAIKWVRSNSQLLLTIVGVVVAIIVLSFLVISKRLEGSIRAAEKFSMAHGMYSQGMLEQAMGVAREVVSQYPESVAASKSRLLLSQIHLEQKKYDEAIELGRVVYETGKPKTIRPFALSMMATINFEKGEFHTAISNCNLFLEKYPDHFLAPRIYELLAFIYKSQGMLNESRQIYEKIIALYPASLWAEKAQSKIASEDFRGQR